MRIGITGATGFIGSRVVKLAFERGHEVVGYSRKPNRRIAGCIEVRRFRFDQSIDLTGLDAVVHLAGEPVFGIWTRKKRQRILDSRKLGTRHLVNSIMLSSEPPAVLVCGSAIGYYGNTGETETDEEAPPGCGFLAQVCQIWEHEALRAREKGVRVVLLRTALVLGKDGGMLKPMSSVFKLGLGGKIGSGWQWMSWIHIHDQAELVLFAVENQHVEGPINCAAPYPCRNAEFTETLARALHRPAFLTAPKWLVRVALGKFSREVLASKRIIPARTLAYEFRYRYLRLKHAFDNIFHR
jgi:uncharacterized protein